MCCFLKMIQNGCKIDYSIIRNMSSLPDVTVLRSITKNNTKRQSPKFVVVDNRRLTITGSLPYAFTNDDMYFELAPWIGEGSIQFPRNRNWNFYMMCGKKECPHKSSSRIVILHSEYRERDDREITRACGNLSSYFCNDFHKCEDYRSESGCDKVHVTVEIDMISTSRGSIRRTRHIRPKDLLLAVHKEINMFTTMMY